MFGTLVVQLPTAAGHKGGALIVRHRRKQRVFAWEDPDGSYARRLGGGAAAAVVGTAAGAPTAAADEVGRGMASTPPSSLPVRCAAFYGDCEHELQTVTSGVRLCLLYNLVRTTPGPQPVAAVGQSGSAAQLRLSDAVAAWGRPGSSCGAAKFIVPLAHEYTKASLSFGGLKGRDRAMADSLRACGDLDLYLVTIVKHESGTAQEDPYERSRYYKREKRHKRSRCWGFGCEEDDDEDGEGCACCGEDESDDESDPEDKEMEEVHETTITAEDWVDGNGDSRCPRLGVDINDHEVLGCVPLEDPDESVEESDDDNDDDKYFDYEYGEGLDLLFPPDTDPTEREYEGYTGNCSPTLDFWYHRAALIFWPSSAKMRVALEKGPSYALRVARERFSEYGDAGELPLADVAMIVSLAETEREKPRRQGYYYPSAPPPGHVFMTDARDTAGVLALCSRAGAAALDSSRRFLRLLAGGTPGAVGTPGLVSEGVSRGVAALMRVVGWQAIGGEVIRVVEACSLEHAGNVAVLVEELLTLFLPPQQQPELQQEGADVKVKAQASQQPGLHDGVGVKAEVQAAQQPVLQHGVDDIKAEVQASQQPEVEDGVDVKAEVQTAQQPVLQDGVGDVKPEAQAVQQPGLEQDGAGVKVEAQASQQPQLQDDLDVKAEVQGVQQPGLEQDGDGVKAETQAAQQPQPELQQEKRSSTGALIASTYVQDITSNPSALERVTSKEVPSIVRLLLLDLPCFSVNASSGANPLLAFFAILGAVHLPTDVLAKAVHEFRGRLDGTTPASTCTAAATGAGGGQPPPHHSSAVVTLATGLYSRGFQDVAAAAVKTFAEDVLWLAASIDGADGLEQGFVGAMVMGTRSGDPSQICRGQGKLKAVLESKAVQAAVRGGGGAGGGKKGSEVFWGGLVSERLVNLEAQAAPKLCWRQPNAIFSKDPQIQHFLRGPESTMIYRGTRGSPFTSIAQARTFSYSFGGVNAKAVARGAGRGAHVEITKTKDLYEKKVKAHKEVRAEVALLRSLLKSIGLGFACPSAAGGGGSVSGSRGGGATAGGANEVNRPTALFAPVSGNVAGVSRVAEAGNGKIGAAGRRPKREVIDLCDSP